jgi:threonine/homoserine efflux transporter RhtA
MSLSPVAATLTGFVPLGQHLTPLQFLAMATVIVASISTVRGDRRPAAARQADAKPRTPEMNIVE